MKSSMLYFIYIFSLDIKKIPTYAKTIFNFVLTVDMSKCRINNVPLQNVKKLGLIPPNQSIP